MKKFFLLASVALVIFSCVEKKMVIRSNPPGADVYLDRKYIGKTPCEVKFVWYGKRGIYIFKEGYQSVNEIVDLSVPFYQIFPLDFITSLLLPFTIHDIRYFEFNLKPEVAQERRVKDILKRAGELRKRIRQK